MILVLPGNIQLQTIFGPKLVSSLSTIDTLIGLDGYRKHINSKSDLYLTEIQHAWEITFQPNENTVDQIITLYDDVIITTEFPGADIKVKDLQKFYNDHLYEPKKFRLPETYNIRITAGVTATIPDWITDRYIINNIISKGETTVSLYEISIDSDTQGIYGPGWMKIIGQDANYAI